MGGYKCASIGCYSFESTETHTLFKKLQTVVNQFANALSFSPLKVDGIIGRGTAEATLLVLGFISESDKGPVGASATSLESGINTTEQLAANAQSVTDTLTLATRSSAVASQTTPAQPISAPSAGPTAAQRLATNANASVQSSSPAVQERLNLIQKQKPALAASLIDRIPPWAAYAGGGLFLVGAVIYGMMSLRSKKGPAAAVDGFAAAKFRTIDINREGLTWEEWRNAARVADPTGLHPEKIKAWRKAWRNGQDPTEAGQH